MAFLVITRNLIKRIGLMACLLMAPASRLEVAARDFRQISTRNKETRTLNTLMAAECENGRQGDMCGGIGIDYEWDGPAAAFKPSSDWTFWPKGVLYYEFDLSTGGAYNQTLFDSAIEEIQNKTCLRVKPRNGNPSVTSYVIVYAKNDSTNGCASFVGMYTKGPQRLTLHPQTNGSQQHCWWKGTIIDELIHAFGFNHEHQRFDRDTYIYVNLSNVQSEYTSQYDIIPLSKTMYNNEAYDFDSIMHYHSVAFGKLDASGNPMQTIFSRPLGTTNRTITHVKYRPYLSTLDVVMINNIYGSICNASTPPTATSASKPKLGWVATLSGMADYWLRSFLPRWL